MGINEALELFDINDISIETEESLKSKFRALTKKYHPDNNKSGDNKKFLSISDAYNELKDALTKIKQYKIVNDERALYTVVIPLYKLVDIYDGGYITVGNSENCVKVDKKEMKKNNSLIISEVSIEHNGLVENFDNIERWSINDNYSINCVINVKDISNSERIKIKILDKEKEFDMTFQSIKIKFTLKHNISVDVIINKKLIVDNEDESTK